MPTTTTPEIMTLYANLPADQTYIEDIYDNLNEATSQHPDQQIVIGYCIIDTNTNSLHNGSKDWYNTYTEAQTALDEIRNHNTETPELYALQPCDDNVIRHVKIKALNSISNNDLKQLIGQMLDFYCEHHNLSKDWRKNVTWDDAIDIALRYPKLCYDFGFEVIVNDNKNKLDLTEKISD